MFFYHVPLPDEAMLITGKRKADVPRVVTGHGAFVIPPFRKYKMLSTASRKAEVTEECLSNEKYRVNVQAVIVFHVPGTDHASILAAAQRFLRVEDDIEDRVQEVFAGHLRSIVGTMTLESLITNREEFEVAVLNSSKKEMACMGLEVDSLKIQTIDDGGRGYIEALSAPHAAKLQQAAKVAQAEADRISVEAQQESERRQAESLRNTTLQKAEYQAEMDRAQAAADQAGPLAHAKAEQDVLVMRSDLARNNALLREQELQTEVVKPAEAEAERVRIEAEARRQRTEIDAAAEARRVEIQAAGIAKSTELNAAGEAKAAEVNAAGAARATELQAEGIAKATMLNADAIKAEGFALAEKERAIGLAKAEAARAQSDAAAANNAIALQETIASMLPQVAASIASGLNGANVTLLNGADGYGQVIASVMQQALAVYGAFKGGVIAPESEPTMPAGSGTAAPLPYASVPQSETENIE